MPAAPALLFDLDGTLVDTARTTAWAFNAIRSERGLPEIHHESIKPYISAGGQELTRFALGEALIDVEADLARFRKILADAPARTEEIYPGVELALAALSSRGCRAAVVTNKPQALADKLLVDLGLASHFCLIVGGDAVPFKKPHPAHIEFVLKSMGVRPEDAVLIGDSEIDAEAAMRSRVRFLHFSRGYCAPSMLERDEHARFDHFDEMWDRLATL